MKILIADDHALFREGLRHVLSGLNEALTVLEAFDCEQSLRIAQSHPDLDLVLLDLKMPDADGFTALDVFVERYPALPVVILSASELRSDVQRALNSGACGFIPKNTTGSIMLNALKLVLSGGVYVPPAMAIIDENFSDTRQSELPGLTPRQMETLALLVKGYPNKEIARYMSLAESTVKMHITAIFKSLNVNNRTQAVLAVEKQKLQLPIISDNFPY